MGGAFLLPVVIGILVGGLLSVICSIVSALKKERYFVLALMFGVPAFLVLVMGVTGVLRGL